MTQKYFTFSKVIVQCNNYHHILLMLYKISYFSSYWGIISPYSKDECNFIRIYHLVHIPIICLLRCYYSTIEDSDFTKIGINIQLENWLISRHGLDEDIFSGKFLLLFETKYFLCLQYNVYAFFWRQYIIPCLPNLGVNKDEEAYLVAEKTKLNQLQEEVIYC